MKTLKKLGAKLRKVKEALKFPDSEKFDDDFREVMKLFHYSGLYRTENTSARLHNASFAFICMCYLLGCIKDTLYYFFEGDVVYVLINGALTTAIFSFAVTVRNFINHQSKIVDLVFELQKLHGSRFNEMMEAYKGFSLKIIKLFEVCCVSAVITMPTAMFFGMSFSTLFYPLIFDVLAFGKLYGLTAVLSIVHIMGLAASYTASDFLHIVCMVRIEANCKILSDLFREAKGEEELTSCIHYHCSILR